MVLYHIHSCMSEKLKALAKRTQHANTTYRNIVGCNMLRAFGHPVAMCCDMLGVVGSNLTSFKLEPTTPNMLQHIATGWPNARNMLRPTMLRYVTLTCCDRLAGALRWLTTVFLRLNSARYQKSALIARAEMTQVTLRRNENYFSN